VPHQYPKKSFLGRRSSLYIPYRPRLPQLRRTFPLREMTLEDCNGSLPPRYVLDIKHWLLIFPSFIIVSVLTHSLID
jgi:hypothetical protein